MKTKTVSVNLSEEDYKRLEKYAQRTARSRGGTLIYAFQVLQKHEPLNATEHDVKLE